MWGSGPGHSEGRRVPGGVRNDGQHRAVWSVDRHSSLTLCLSSPDTPTRHCVCPHLKDLPDSFPVLRQCSCPHLTCLPDTVPVLTWHTHPTLFLSSPNTPTRHCSCAMNPPHLAPLLSWILHIQRCSRSHLTPDL